MSTKPPSRTAAQFVVRLPDGMRERIAEQAVQNGRSMNAEIVARLESSFAGGDQSALVAAISRLNFDLAKAEFEKHHAETKANGLARSLDMAADAILLYSGGRDPTAKGIAEAFALEAKPFVQTPESAADEMRTRLANLSKALSELKSVAPMAEQDEPVTETSPGKSPAPPKPKRRIVRKVTKPD